MLRDMTEQVLVTRDINAPAERVWEMVSDVTRMGEWSPENEGAKWLGGATGPTPGAKFRGVNRIGKRTWKTEAVVIDAEPGRRFSFRVYAAGLKIAEWTYAFESIPTGCRVTETYVDQRLLVMKLIGKMVSGVGDRATHNRTGMEQTLDNLAAAAEPQN